jgi:predicted  nucleic acid-binding Zn-ribbon protein
MKATISLFVSIILVAVFVQCSSNDIEKLEQEVLALHDTVMVEMQDLRSVQQQLDATLSELDSLPADSIDMDYYTELQDAKAMISSSYKEMMDWMRDYNKPSGDTPEEEVKTYLEAQHESMKSIRKKMQDGINQANDLLKDS